MSDYCDIHKLHYLPCPICVSKKSGGSEPTSANVNKKRISTYNYDYQRKTLIEYMKIKMEECDWHGVSDCANDLRVIEARYGNNNDR